MTTDMDDDEIVLLSHRESFRPYGQYLGSYETYQNMHFEMDIEVHSFGSTNSWYGILLCTNGSYGDYYPRIMMHPLYSTSNDSRLGGFSVRFSRDGDYSGEALQMGAIHHLELDITSDTMVLTQDGVIENVNKWMDHATGISVDCYAWEDGSFDYANVTVANLLVTTTGMVLTICNFR